MKGMMQWWRTLVAKWRCLGQDPEAARIEELNQEVELLSLEEQTAQTVAKLAQAHPGLGSEQARLSAREASELAVRRRTLEAQRDVLQRRQSRAG